MEYLDKAIAGVFGVWAPWILVGAAVVVWVATKVVPGWVSGWAKSLRGSPSSERYWRSRLVEGLEQYKADLSDAEKTQLAARVTKARTLVEAHEARRLLGFGGATGLWTATAIFLIAASLFWGGSTVSTAALVIAIVLSALTVAFEFLALFTTSWTNARVLVLAEAGRRGHSDLVRDDPWAVLREYDYWVRKVSPGGAKKRKAEDKKRAGARRRFERSMLGLSAYPSAIVIDTDIWSQYPVSGLNAEPFPATRRAPAPETAAAQPAIHDAESTAPEVGA
ncbi:hypothetical protein [Microbacterium lacticum]|uniref:hypothetical protein n=1 Tax=Microbacterium lacticum TaxID=33885 RepID=UPI001F573218|nr:hypothetical protein [Microbacterium lacticum]